MNFVGCDFHTRFQIAMVNTETGEMVERRICHQGKEVERFYGSLSGNTVVGMEATGYLIWFHEVLDRLEVELRVGDGAKIREQQVGRKKNKHKRRPVDP